MRAKKKIQTTKAKKNLVLKDTGLILATLNGLKDDNFPNDPVSYARTQLNSEQKKLANPNPAIVVLNNARMPTLRFAPEARVIAGGGGIVIQCLHERINTLNYALKINRPSLYPETKIPKQRSVELAKAKEEYLKHAPLSHPNICRAFFHEQIAIPKTQADDIKVSVTLMEWIDGATNLRKYLLEKCKTWTDVVSIFRQCFEGLAYLHQQGLVHWDIKSDNIQVDVRGIVKIMDFGNARYIGSGNTDNEAQSSDWNVPPSLITFRKGKQHTSSKRATFSLPDSSWDSVWLDMWMLAREFNRLLEADKLLLQADATFSSSAEKGLYNSEETKKFLDRCFPSEDGQSSFSIKYLRLILRRLLRPIAPNPMATHFYNSANQVVTDLGKLSPEFGDAQTVSELQAVPQHVMRLPHCGNAPFTRRIGKLFNSEPVRRLANHLQLATLAHIYPGASHRRHEHVAGVTAATIDYVRALYSNRSDPFWRLSIGAQDVEAVIVAGLLHDVGHFAFAHFLEEMSGLFKGFQHEDYILYVLDATRTAGFGAEIARVAEKDRAAIDKVFKKYWHIPEPDLESFRRKVANIIELPPLPSGSPITDPEAILDRAKSERLTLEILHSIISSSIDADKFDYLVRDALHCGVPYAQAIDTERFYQSLTVVANLPKETIKLHTPGSTNPNHLQASIGVTEKGILPVESILLARYQMFFSVYWHHTGRAESAMLQYLVQRLIESPDENQIRTNMEQLIQFLRDHHDSKVLEWFEEKIREKKFHDEEKLLNILAGLSGQRKHLYWPAYQLEYEGPGDDVREQAKYFNEVLSKCFDEVHSKDGRKSVLDALAELRREFQKSFCAEIAKHLGERTRAKTNSATSKLRTRSIPKIEFAPSDILLDIPPAGKDQVGNIFVTNESGRIRSIRRLSPIADAVGDAFMYWVRRVRVFLSRPAWYHCNALGLKDSDVEHLCAAAMKKFVLKQNKQQELFESGGRTELTQTAKKTKPKSR